jgi:hypothetical protein
MKKPISAKNRVFFTWIIALVFVVLVLLFGLAYFSVQSGGDIWDRCVFPSTFWCRPENVSTTLSDTNTLQFYFGNNLDKSVRLNSVSVLTGSKDVLECTNIKINGEAISEGGYLLSEGQKILISADCPDFTEKRPFYYHRHSNSFFSQFYVSIQYTDTNNVSNTVNGEILSHISTV